MTTNTKTSTSSEPRTYLCPVKEPLFNLHVKSGKYISSVTKQFHKEKSDFLPFDKNHKERTDKDRTNDRASQRSRLIKDIRCSNEFEWCAVLSWRSKKRRNDIAYQDKAVRRFLEKLRKKYPDISYFAVRHKNEECTGYHVHLCLGNVPRRLFRIRKGKFDRNRRQTYCLLGWSKEGWCSAEKITSSERFICYLGKRAKMKLIPEGVKSIVTYSKNLKRPDRHTEVRSEDEYEDFKSSISNRIINDREFIIVNGIYGVPVRHTVIKGEVDFTPVKEGDI